MSEPPDYALLDFIAFIVGDDVLEGPDQQRDWQRLVAVRSILNRYGKLPHIERTTGAIKELK